MKVHCILDGYLAILKLPTIRWKKQSLEKLPKTTRGRDVRD